MSDKALKNQNQGAIKLFLKIKLQSAVGTEISLANLLGNRGVLVRGSHAHAFNFNSLSVH